MAFGIIAIVAFAALLWLGRGMTFFADEWAFIETRSLGDPRSWFVPHNEHWVTIPVLLYRTVVETVGIGSYVPYLVVLLVLHVAVAALVYRLTLRSAGPRFALVAATIALFLGGGFENLYWGFQISFVGSTLFGLIAMEVTDGEPDVAPGVAGRRRCSSPPWRPPGSGSWSPSPSASSGSPTGAGGRTCPTSSSRPGSSSSGTWPSADTVSARIGIRSRQRPSRRSRASWPTGSAPCSVSWRACRRRRGSLVLAAVLIAVGIRHPRRLRSPRVIGIAVAIVAQYALAALVRAHLFEGQAEYTRYVYTPAILALVAAGVLVRGIKRTSEGRKRLYTTVGLAVWATTALILNGRLLIAGRELFLARADMTRALVTVALAPDRPSGVDTTRSLVLVPSPDALRLIVERYGDPRTDSLIPGSVRPIPPEILTEARRRLIEGAPLPR